MPVGCSNNKDPMSITAEVVLPLHAKLGEGPIWNDQKQELAWVDINSKLVCLFDPKTRKNRTFPMPSSVGTIVPRKSGGYVVALQDEIAALDPATGALTMLHRLDNPGGKVRYNDGKCDPSGRLWVGTLAYDGTAGAGALYCCDARTHRCTVSDISCSNGIVWSADEQTMYYIDSPTRTVDAFDYDAASGEITNRRVALSIPEKYGMPDGMTIDAEGMIWIGMWGGGIVLHADPKAGKILGQIKVPGASAVTACAFGGKNLDELYITSAHDYQTEEELKSLPNAGCLFLAKPGVRGVPACAYAG
jgi:sugar lactone lactonase YvrE